MVLIGLPRGVLRGTPAREKQAPRRLAVRRGAGFRGRRRGCLVDQMRSPGQAERPNFGGLVRGCVEADFWK